MRRFTRLALVTLPALALAGCATMNVSSYVVRGVDFTQYRTYAWGPTEARPTGDPRLDSNPFFKDRLEGAVEIQLPPHAHDGAAARDAGPLPRGAIEGTRSG